MSFSASCDSSPFAATYKPQDLIDPVVLTQELIKCQSVTPYEGGALTLLESWLSCLGFTCHRLRFSDDNTPDVENLFAIREGKKDFHFCFAGHTDVVPAGPLQSWSEQPFAAKIKNEHVIGRGAVDMKGGIACFIAGLAKLFCESTSEIPEKNQQNSDHHYGEQPDYTLSFLITGDEESVAINGTKKVLEWMKENNYSPDFCLVGEPTSMQSLGDTIKIGRRGSLNAKITFTGKQGHVAFPEKSDNPITRLVNCLAELTKGPKEGKSDFFEPSNLEVTSIDVGNATTNLIPEQVTARFNIRFNDLHSGESLRSWIENTAQKYCKNTDYEFEFSGEAEFVEPDETVAKLANAIESITAQKPDMTTAGATSDARFIRHYCPVIEFGLVGETMHQINEQVSVKDLNTLSEIYKTFLQNI